MVVDIKRGVDVPHPPDNRPDRERPVKGRIVSELRAEGKELVDEERLSGMFLDLQAEGYIDYDPTPVERVSKRAMEILRG